MKFRDKLEQYIKREVDSISYHEEEQMWEEFQKKKRDRLVLIIPTSYFFPILMSSLVLGFSAFYFFSQPTIEENFDTKGPITQLKNTSSTENSKINIEESEKPLDEILIELDKKLDEKPTSENLSFNENSKLELKKERTADLGEKLLVKSRNEDFNVNQNFEIAENITNKFSFSNKSYESFSNVDSEGSSKTKSEELPKTQKEVFQLKSNKNSKIKKGRFTNLELIKEDSSQLYIEAQKLATPFKSLTPVRARSERYIRAGLTGSFNRIYTSSLELGFKKMTSNNTGFKINLGGSVVDGYSFSQDEILLINGITITSIETDKDLDFILSSHLSGEFFIRRKAFSFGLGIKNSYAIFNRFNIITTRTSILFDSEIGGTFENLRLNLWNGINRFRVEPFATFSYRNGEYEWGIVASKRLNKLINEDLAAKRKSNIPVQVGLNLTKYF